MKQRHVEIAGAGLAGLAAAIRFAQSDWKVRVHERNDDLRMFGAGIFMWENGLKTLEYLGVLEQTLRNARRIKEWRICDGGEDTTLCRASTPKDRILVPPRADLYHALVDRAVELGVDIRTSSTVVGADEDGTLKLEGGSEIKADLVVSAEGVGSKIREGLSLTRWVDYGCVTGVRMLVERQLDRPGDIVTEYWQKTWRILYTPCTEEQDYVFLGAPIDDSKAQTQPIDRGAWSEKFPYASRLIDNLVEDGHWDLIGNIKTRDWYKGRVALIGDAAHGMPPNLGQAANMAFTNVMSLVYHLDQEADISAALENWQCDARPATDHVQRWSHIYDYVLAKWPKPLLPFRPDMLKRASSLQAFREGFDLGAHTVPRLTEDINR